MSAETPFLRKLKSSLMTKVAETSADLYLSQLMRLNDKKPIKNLTFLKDVPAIMTKIESLAPSTRKSILGGVVSVLSHFKGYKKYHAAYRAKMMEAQAELESKRGDLSDKTEKEKESWVNWEEVVKKRDELRDSVKTFGKILTPAQYDMLLAYLLLSLYTYIPPRRNKDFQDMWVVRQWDESMPSDRNYLDLHGQRFIFNTYKTVKQHGRQIVDIPETDDESPLKEAIVAYLLHNPHYRSSKDKSKTFRFLTKQDGSPLTAVNAITRVLNKTFGGKNVGSSMLRHSFLSDKYGGLIREMEGDAAAMAHSPATQRTYIRADDDVITHVV
jgi:integrase